MFTNSFIWKLKSNSLLSVLNCTKIDILCSACITINFMVHEWPWFYSFISVLYTSIYYVMLCSILFDFVCLIVCLTVNTCLWNLLYSRLSVFLENWNPGYFGGIQRWSEKSRWESKNWGESHGISLVREDMHFWTHFFHICLNFVKYWPIFELISLLESGENL